MRVSLADTSPRCMAAKASLSCARESGRGKLPLSRCSAAYQICAAAFCQKPHHIANTGSPPIHCSCMNGRNGKDLCCASSACHMVLSGQALFCRFAGSRPEIPCGALFFSRHPCRDTARPTSQNKHPVSLRLLGQEHRVLIIFYFGLVECVRCPPCAGTRRSHRDKVPHHPGHRGCRRTSAHGKGLSPRRRHAQTRG